jgi:hypothetical protein
MERTEAFYASRSGSASGYPARKTIPCGVYPVPVKSTRPLAVITARTVISFCVRVPVLSVQITVVEPSVSTAESLRTICDLFPRCAFLKLVERHNSI